MKQKKKPIKIFVQIKGFLKTVFKTIETAIMAIPLLALDALLHPGAPIWALIVFLMGLAWLAIGDFIIDHSHIFEDILTILVFFAEIIGDAFEITLKTVELCIDVIITIVNAGGSAINFLGGLFGDDHVVPKIPLIVITPFTPLDFTKYIKAIQEMGNARVTCRAFESIFFEVVYPIRSALNIHICPIVRYTFHSLIYVPFDWLMSLFHFGSDPNRNNCFEPDAWVICFWLRFGSILSYVIAPLQVFYWLMKPLSRLFFAILKLMLASVGLAFGFFSDFLHLTFHKRDNKKSV